MKGPLRQSARQYAANVLARAKKAGKAFRRGVKGLNRDLIVDPKERTDRFSEYAHKVGDLFYAPFKEHPRLAYGGLALGTAAAGGGAYAAYKKMGRSRAPRQEDEDYAAGAALAQKVKAALGTVGRAGRGARRSAAEIRARANIGGMYGKGRRGVMRAAAPSAREIATQRGPGAVSRTASLAGRRAAYETGRARRVIGREARYARRHPGRTAMSAVGVGSAAALGVGAYRRVKRGGRKTKKSAHATSLAKVRMALDILKKEEERKALQGNLDIRKVANTRNVAGELQRMGVVLK